MGVIGFLRKHYILSGMTGFILSITAVGLLYVGLTTPSGDDTSYVQGEQSLSVTRVASEVQPLSQSISDKEMLIDVGEGEGEIPSDEADVPFKAGEGAAAKWSVGTLDIKETLHDVYVVFECTNPYVNTTDVILYDSYKSKVFEPLETEVLPIGTVIFEVDRLKRGTWYIALNDITGYDVGFGTSLCFILTEEELVEWLTQFKEENRVQPRGLSEEQFYELYDMEQVIESSEELEIY